MLGVNATTDSVSRLEKVAWRRTLGWGSADTPVRAKLKPKPAQAGS